MSEKHNKTEQPTPKRLRDAKKKGQVARSSDLNPAISLLLLSLLINSIGKHIYTRSLETIKLFIQMDYKTNINIKTVKTIIYSSIVRFLIIFLPISIILIILGVITNILQVGFLFTTDPLKPDFKRLNPIQGLKNIFSKKSLINLIKSIFKIIIVFYLTYKNLTNSVSEIINSGNLGIEKLFFYYLDFIKQLSINIGIVVLIIAIIDYALEKREYIQNLKMTKQEVMDELKEMEGDPNIKSERRYRQRELSMGRMMKDLETSTVVVTNPTHLAVGIRYDEEKDYSPIVTAKGAGRIAERIKEIANTKEIPIIENKPLARTLYKDIEIGNEIPEKLYQTVAEILVMVYRMEQDKKGKI